ncbi:hypothetical protein K7I13_12410 [Brucepastera parasyntrophica]|uniref:hypothetical protein n=1 Tax=Brucepastera parasyntrophica TaxID=2880008 RepID=UPI002108D9C8|nr:hypothetical protein [Brucepastera parasyntrophica]ULQ59284.1 hypothetical protein K7I13_12410 [Brucepastera parasyntrophica]
MKRILSIGMLLAMCCTWMVFADDAKTMPARVGRFYVAPSFSFVNGAYDDDGELDKFGDDEGAVKVFNLGFALEYGILDWLTAALQWAPGWTIWSDVDTVVNPLATDQKININGVYDLFLGAKIQIIGEKAPVKSSMFRLAIAPGIKIPLPGTDFDDQYENLMKGDDVTIQNADKHVFAFGGRFYFDFIIHPMFFINLYSEFIYYPVKGKADNIIYHLGDLDTEYGFDLTFELEPHFEMAFDAGTLGIGLPLNYTMFADKKYDTVGIDDVTDASLLKLSPNIAFMLTKIALPLEFKLTYAIPLYGMNYNALNTVSLQIRLYFRI